MWPQWRQREKIFDGKQKINWRDTSNNSSMFKWKVSGLGGKKDKSKGQQQQTKLNNEPPSPTDGADIKNNNNNNNKSKDNKKDK